MMHFRSWMNYTRQLSVCVGDCKCDDYLYQSDSSDVVCGIFSLGKCTVLSVCDKKDSDRIVKALTWRNRLSMLLFIILIFAFAMGWIQPHPIA